MTITTAQFRQWFPEFTSVVDYPESSMQFWLNISDLPMINEQRLTKTPGPNNGPSLYDLAQCMFVAHNIVLEKQALDAARTGGTPGGSVGPIASKSLGPGSITYDVNSVIYADAGFWNGTPYGLRYWWLVQMAGAGPVFVGAGTYPPTGPWGPPWPGPLPYVTGIY
jgi:Protein of unknown function (DUF4054)